MSQNCPNRKNVTYLLVAGAVLLLASTVLFIVYSPAGLTTLPVMPTPILPPLPTLDITPPSSLAELAEQYPDLAPILTDPELDSVYKEFLLAYEEGARRRRWNWPASVVCSPPRATSAAGSTTATTSPVPGASCICAASTCALLVLRGDSTSQRALLPCLWSSPRTGPPATLLPALWHLIERRSLSLCPTCSPVRSAIAIESRNLYNCGQEDNLFQQSKDEGKPPLFG